MVNLEDENGLRVITAEGVSYGLDASQWLVEDVAGTEARENLESWLQ